MFSPMERLVYASLRKARNRDPFKNTKFRSISIDLLGFTRNAKGGAIYSKAAKFQLRPLTEREAEYYSRKYKDVVIAVEGSSSVIQALYPPNTIFVFVFTGKDSW